jgi:tetratricopeptide (TPR) repeat protein
MYLPKSQRVAAGFRAVVVLAVGLLFLNGWAGDPSQDTIPLQLIVVESPGEAERILEQLKSGEDFATLARQKSVDASSVDGGFMGNVDPKLLRAELRDSLQGLEPGKLSGVVKIPSGYAILKMLPHAEVMRTDANRARMSAVSASGSVVFLPEVSGLDEATAAMPQLGKADDWGQDLHGVCDTHIQSYSAVMDWATQLLEPANAKGVRRNANAKPLDLAQAYIAKAQLYAYQGNMDKAIEQFEAAQQVAPPGASGIAPYVDQLLGISYLHKAEMDNDVYRNPGERCLFPISSQVRYAQTASSKKAVEYFLKYLEHKPAALDVKWLLNLAYMTLGEYPSGVPSKYLLPPSAFASSESVGRFTDVAPACGLNLFAMASGVVVDDFANDGLFDVVTSSWDACEPMHYFHNNGDGTFTDKAAKAGLSDQLGGLNLIQTDYNNDGCLDILVLRGAWEHMGQRKSLLRNNCDGTFTDVTKASGLAKPATNTQAAVWADIDNDGFLDLFVGNESGPSQLFRNKGDGTFEDISHAAGIDRVEFTKGVVAGDYDNDGYVDFYVTNLNTANFLYHNNHDGTFSEVAKQAGVPGTGRTFASWFFDYDNDGWPDLFVTSSYASVDETVRNYLKLPHNGGTLRLYKNLGNFTFKDVTREVELDRVYMPMGANFGDVDNDGYLDIYLGTGNPSYGSLVPNVLLHNKEGKLFVDITASSGTGELHKGHGVAFADIDNDGDEDIITSIGGATPGDRHAMRVFENPGNGNDWISLKLVGVKANRAAIGARIKVTVKNEGREPRAVYRTVGSGGSFGASPLQQHIGLGKSAEIVSLEIWWPGGGKTPQSFSNVAKNQFLEIKELSPTYTKLDRRPYRLGGAKRAAADRAIRAAEPKAGEGIRE